MAPTAVLVAAFVVSTFLVVAATTVVAVMFAAIFGEGRHECRLRGISPLTVSNEIDEWWWLRHSESGHRL